LNVRKRGPIHRIGLLNPRLLDMTAIPIIVHIGARNADPRRPGVGERRRLSFNTPVLMIMINDERRAFSGLVIGRRKHFPGTRYEFVERR
jgi:hypothetical protein